MRIKVITLLNISGAFFTLTMIWISILRPPYVLDVTQPPADYVVEASYNKHIINTVRE